MGSKEEKPIKPEIVIEKNSNSSSRGSGKSIPERFNEFGQSLKSRALNARDTANNLPNSELKQHFLQTSKACAYLSLFIMYRSYRGFFVILPAVYREVKCKLKLAIDNPFDDDSISNEERARDVEPKRSKIRIRTSIIV